MTMMSFEPIAVPLREDEQGALRVGKTRVLLDLVIHEFRSGASPEEIVESYEALNLADVYAVLSVYLQNPDPIDEYVRRREEETEAIRRNIESTQVGRPNLRAVLTARAKDRANVEAR